MKLIEPLTKCVGGIEDKSCSLDTFDHIFSLSLKSNRPDEDISLFLLLDLNK